MTTRGHRAPKGRANDDASTDFCSFVRSTYARWRAIARHLYRRFRAMCPAWYELTDLEQDVIVGAWEAFEDFDPHRTALGRTNYVAWRARQYAQKAILRAAEVPQHRRAGQPRFAKGESLCSESELSAMNNRSVVYDPDAYLDGRARLMAIAQTLPEVHAVREWFRTAGDFDLAADRLYEDPSSRLACRLNSAEQAKRIAVQSVMRVVERVQQEAKS